MKNYKSENFKVFIIFLLVIAIIYILYKNNINDKLIELVVDNTDNNTNTEKFENEYTTTDLNQNITDVMNILNNNKVNDYKPYEIKSDIAKLISNIDPITINKANIITSYHKRLEDEINELNPELSLSEIPTTFIKNNNGIELDLIPTKDSNDNITHYNIETPNGCLNHNGNVAECDTTNNNQQFKIIKVKDTQSYNDNIHPDNIELQSYPLNIEFDIHPFNIVKVDCDDCDRANYCLNVESTNNKHKIYLNKCDNVVSQRFYV